MHKLPIDNLLAKLDKVTAKKSNQDGLNQWQAICPAHDDKTPSLTVTQAENGIVLVKCWAGCHASEIVTRIGLALKDLFPQLKNKPRSHQPSKRAIEHERLIISIAEGNFSKGVTSLSSEDMARYRLAVKRLKEVN